MTLSKQVVLVLVCASLLILGLQSVTVVKANFKPAPLPAVHITSDGDVSNSSALIHRSGNIYTLTGNWSSTSYFLEVDRARARLFSYKHDV